MASRVDVGGSRLGEFWASDCNDTGGPQPAPDTVKVSFVQDGTRQLLGTTTASDGYKLTFTVVAPAHPTRSLPFTGSTDLMTVAPFGLSAIAVGVALTHKRRVTR